MIPTLLLLHLVIGVALVAAGDRFGARSFAVAGLAPLATVVALAAEAAAVTDGRPVFSVVSWISQLDLMLEFRLDAMALTMALIVSGIGVLVCIYAVGYFSSPKAGLGRLAGLLVLFAGAMLGVATADHLLALFVFWELTSVTSYLLIGNDDENPRARASALTAILVTGLGGLVMLAGLVLLGQSAGTYRLSELVAAPPDGASVAVGGVLILVGAFSKSAQFPLGGWLPGAMVAPTPISTYLHAATMVKAGVFLAARLAPALATVGPWRPLLLTVGSITMITGGWRALRQHDLKLLLAYGTVSQLGLLMLLLGAGEYPAAQAGILLLLAHAAFKAALFMVVGIVDHQTGTRDIRRLPRLGAGWRLVSLTAIAGGASMAGVPPLVGFVSKEKALAALDGGSFAGATVVLAIVVAGSVLTFGYSARFVLGVHGWLHEDPAPDEQAGPERAVRPPAGMLVAPAASLAAASLLVGLVPDVVDRLVRAATTDLYVGSGVDPKPVQLWAGFNTALALSAVIIVAGLVLVVARTGVERLQRRAHDLIDWVPDSDRAFTATVSAAQRFGRQVTALLQNGSLPTYLVVILGVTAVAPLIPGLTALDELPAWIGTWVHVPIATLIVCAAISAALVRRRIAAALMLGAVGFGMSAFYVVQGAPDLALTQFTIETLATVLFVLVLRFLPREFVPERRAVLLPVRLAVSVLVGGAVFVMALVAANARSDVTAAPVSDAMLERAVPDGKGANVVNVILVDFRGLDTLGEITVLVVAAIGLVALARAARRPGDTVRAAPPFAHLPVVDASARLLYPSILVLAAYFLFAGHNQPGGGFVGGLTAGAAISLRYVAGGVEAVRRSFRLAPWTVLGGGLGIAAATAVVPLVLGHNVLEHAAWEFDAPLLGTVKTTSALPFDVGVFLVVVGVILMAYEAFGEAADPADDPATGDPAVDDSGDRTAVVGS